MATWNEWCAYLDGRLTPTIGVQLPQIDEFIEGTRQRRTELGLTSRRSPVIDDLCSTTVFLGCLLESAAESHHRAASLLYSQGKEAAWFPAALPNCEEIRLVKRVSVRRRGE